MDAEKIQYARQILELPDDAIVGVDELATVLALPQGTVQQMCSRSPDRLPPRWRKTRMRLRQWRMGDVRQWLRGE